MSRSSPLRVAQREMLALRQLLDLVAQRLQPRRGCPAGGGCGPRAPRRRGRRCGPRCRPARAARRFVERAGRRQAPSTRAAARSSGSARRGGPWPPAPAPRRRAAAPAGPSAPRAPRARAPPRRAAGGGSGGGRASLARLGGVRLGAGRRGSGLRRRRRLGRRVAGSARSAAASCAVAASGAVLGRDGGFRGGRLDVVVFWCHGALARLIAHAGRERVPTWRLADRARRAGATGRGPAGRGFVFGPAAPAGPRLPTASPTSFFAIPKFSPSFATDVLARGRRADLLVDVQDLAVDADVERPALRELALGRDHAVRRGHLLAGVAQDRDSRGRATRRTSCCPRACRRSPRSTPRRRPG